MWSGRLQGSAGGPAVRPDVACGLNLLAPCRAARRTVEPPERLVFSWAWDDEAEAGEPLVTLELLDQGKATEMVLTHERFPNRETPGQAPAGLGRVPGAACPEPVGCRTLVHEEQRRIP